MCAPRVHGWHTMTRNSFIQKNGESMLLCYFVRLGISDGMQPRSHGWCHMSVYSARFIYHNDKASCFFFTISPIFIHSKKLIRLLCSKSLQGTVGARRMARCKLCLDSKMKYAMYHWTCSCYSQFHMAHSILRS